MIRATRPMAPTSGRTTASLSLSLAAVALVVLLLGIPAFSVPASSSSAPVAHPTSAAPLAAASPSALAASGPRASAPVAPATSATFNPPCYPIDLGVCVSIALPTETNIVPPLGTFVSTAQPNSTSDLPLVIKSRVKLDWPAAAHYGQKSPINLNVSANLWNGDPYYSIQQGDYYHAANPQNVWTGPFAQPSNISGYVYWYNVSISAKSSNNVRLFFPGETVTWWIELTYNNSYTYVHHESPHFVFTYSGAWPYSPYPGSNQYAGSSATFQDISLTVDPLSPNWNDSVNLVLNTTQADVISNATIGAAYVDVSEMSQYGSPLLNGTFTFPVSVSTAGYGATSTSVRIPAAYAQSPGATVTYALTIFDVPGDQLVTPPATWVVGGNGSFLSGVFVDDLVLNSSPSSVIALGAAVLNPGQQLNLTLTSRNPGTSISSAQVVAEISYPLLRQTVSVTRTFTRVSSTIFTGSIQGLPLGSFVNFTVLAWDFNQRLEVSSQFGYSTPDFQTYDPILDANATFFYVLVFDNSSHTWVNGVKVQVQGPSGGFNSVGNTTLGLAYPNQTRNNFLPLLLAANASYTITVTDPYFVPAGAASASPVTVNVLGLHEMTTTHQTLAQAPTYAVVQQGNEILFWLNATPPAPTPSPSVPGGTVPIAGVIGLVAIAIAAVPLGMWWSQIRARRKEEEKRVTL